MLSIGFVKIRLGLQEWVLDFEALESLAMLEVLAVEEATLTFDCRS
jgi:hypothetical protein